MSEVTRGEFDMLRDQVARDAARMESIDTHGSRGVGIIQEQLTELVKDVIQLKSENDRWQKQHLDEHKQEKRDRISGRRWLIGTAIAGMTALAGLYGVLVFMFQHLHK